MTEVNMKLDGFSFGGGIQSMACLVLAAQGVIDCRLFLFANVGDDSEHPDTIAYLHDVAEPYAARNGIELCTVAASRTLYQEAMRENRRVPLPIYLSNGAPGNRTCTADFKIRIIAREIKRRGATQKTPWVCGLGISTDEAHRANYNSRIAWQTLEYPLLDLRISRANCVGIIERAGLPVPPKSACWFCPFQSDRRWHELRTGRPDLFQAACELETRLNEKRGAIGRDVVALHRSTIPLIDAIQDTGSTQLDLFESDICDSGYCFI